MDALSRDRVTFDTVQEYWSYNPNQNFLHCLYLIDYNKQFVGYSFFMAYQPFSGYLMSN